NAGKCNTNLCPVGVTSHLPHLEAGLVVEEKRFRTANYLRTMREGLFMLGASCGIDSPVKFSKEHIALRETNNYISKVKDDTETNKITQSKQVQNNKEQEEKQEKELVRSYKPAESALCGLCWFLLNFPFHVYILKLFKWTVITLVIMIKYTIAII